MDENSIMSTEMRRRGGWRRVCLTYFESLSERVLPHTGWPRSWWTSGPRCPSRAPPPAAEAATPRTETPQANHLQGSDRLRVWHSQNSHQVQYHEKVCESGILFDESLKEQLRYSYKWHASFCFFNWGPSGLTRRPICAGVEFPPQAFLFLKCSYYKTNTDQIWLQKFNKIQICQTFCVYKFKHLKTLMNKTDWRTSFVKTVVS